MCFGIAENKNEKKMINLKHKKIYLVDDDPFIAELFHHHLDAIGFQDVTIFNNGISALNRLIDQPEIIFLDYQMDTLNGFELLQKIKRFNPNILVVMVSGQDDMNVAIDSLKYGAFDYIVKGRNELEKMEEVLGRIEIYLSSLAASQSTLLKNVRSLFKKN